MEIPVAEIGHEVKIPIEEAESSGAQVQISEGSLYLNFEAEPSQHLVSLVCRFSKERSFNQLVYETSSFFQVTFFLKSQHGWVRVSPITSIQEGHRHHFWFPVLYTQEVQMVFWIPDGLLARLRLDALTFSLGAKLSFKASSQKDRLWVPENLVDGREDYGWASLPADTPQEEFLDIDLGMAYYVVGISLCSTKENPPCFPRAFSMALSADLKLWENIANEELFYAAPFSWYSWQFRPIKARYLRIHIRQSYPRRRHEYLAQILEMRVFAAAENFLQTHTFMGLTYASELIPGVVQLSELGGCTPNKVVQANDPRLRLATTEYPGIVQLARDNQTGENLAVQANDSRLRLATENYPGIMQFARHGEARAGYAVQADDPRLRVATTQYPGIVQLAQSGENRPGVVVQGNDERLQLATEKSAGIVILAADGSTRAGEAVQGNDRRLRLASIAWPGIVQLAAHGEQAANKAVQSDDPRLLEGDENTKGRVQFARAGEKVPLKALQANDPRLEPATQESYGLVRFARPGHSIPNHAVEATDPRLSDARHPLPHEHDYAPRHHSFNDHMGTLNIKQDIKTPEPDHIHLSAYNQFPFSVQNKAGWAGGMEGGFFSVAENRPAILALAEKKEALITHSQQGVAALFFSEKNWGVRIPQTLAKLKGSGLALWSEGIMLSDGTIFVRSGTNLCLAFSNFTSEVFTEGDILTIDSSGKVAKMKKEDDTLLGIFTRQPGIVLLPAEKEPDTRDLIFVAVQGIVPVRVVGSVNAGDPISLDGQLPGVGQVSSRGKKYLFIALEGNTETREKTVPCVLVR